jgi:hypothetical protein
VKVAHVGVEADGADGGHDLVEENGVAIAEEGVDGVAGWAAGAAVEEGWFVEEVLEAVEVGGGAAAFMPLQSAVGGVGLGGAGVGQGRVGGDLAGLLDGLLEGGDGVGDGFVLPFAVGPHDHGAHVVEFAEDECLGEVVAEEGVVVGGGLGQAELAVFAEGGGEVALKTAVLVEEGDFGVLFHEGGDGGTGEGAVTLDDDAIYFDEGDADFALFCPCFFVFGDVDDEGIAVFFDEGLLFGQVEGCHLEFHC